LFGEFGSYGYDVQVGDQLGVGVVPTYWMVQIGKQCQAWNASNKLQDWVWSN
jgi:hypothetical protein